MEPQFFRKYADLITEAEQNKVIVTNRLYQKLSFYQKGTNLCLFV